MVHRQIGRHQGYKSPTRRRKFRIGNDVQEVSRSPCVSVKFTSFLTQRQNKRHYTSPLPPKNDVKHDDRLEVHRSSI